MTAYIGLGSNLGDRAGNLLLAVRGLMETGLCVNRLSAIYETDPVGVTEHDNYLNMVAEITLTNITPSQILARMIRLEYLLGRRHKFLLAPRTVDLDLLLFGELHLDTEFLQIPHPRMHLRKFVLVPLAELAPHLIHPTENRSIIEILDALSDESDVKRWFPTSESIDEFENHISKATSPG
ncbi:MAG: 2-amino-4-hydroxy-6-hydroxymethyldihydropteridine diphosphokinase [Acidobacteria bacterium]|nr:2-amino-4-hydroxy-6-hydroxymethyldihydropteridine diphosphokinase [Acidobacteriota bacterium]